MAQDSSSEPVNADTPVRAKEEKTSATQGPEAAEVSKVVGKHRGKRKATLSRLHAQIASLLASPPTDPQEMKKWRKQLRDAVKAERIAAAEIDAAMREEVETTTNKLRPATARQEN